MSKFTCSFPGADDHSLFQKFECQHKNNPHYHSPQLKLKDPQFTVLHYASDVSYSIQVCDHMEWGPEIDCCLKEIKLTLYIDALK